MAKFRIAPVADAGTDPVRLGIKFVPVDVCTGSATDGRRASASRRSLAATSVQSRIKASSS